MRDELIGELALASHELAHQLLHAQPQARRQGGLRVSHSKSSISTVALSQCIGYLN
jgi:hypothetical protein